jgi:hypothetical protein
MAGSGAAKFCGDHFDGDVGFAARPCGNALKLAMLVFRGAGSGLAAHSKAQEPANRIAFIVSAMPRMLITRFKL